FGGPKKNRLFITATRSVYSIYHDKTVHKVISNGIRWAQQKHTDGRILENWHRAEPLHGRPDKAKV
ncbi:hypothetical protein ACCS78_33100, partial [Rhizobium johnstonii]